MPADVSVVIATHNRAALVTQAIDSVLAQSESVREIIVVDDGSTDDTRDALARYGDRIRAFSQEAAGASAARNRAMRAATGEWLAFLDDDDVWLPTKIERQMHLVRADPQLGLVYCSDHAVDDQLQILYTRAADPANRGDVFERLLMRNFVFTSCVMALRDAVHAAGYMDLQFRFAQDWDLWLKIAARYRVDFVAEPVVLYRQSAAGCLTRDIRLADRLREIEAIVNRAVDFRAVPSAVSRFARSEVDLQWAACWLGEQRQLRAGRHALRALARRPASRHAYRLLAYSVTPVHVRELMKRWAQGRLNPGAGRV